MAEKYNSYITNQWTKTNRLLAGCKETIALKQLQAQEKEGGGYSYDSVYRNCIRLTDEGYMAMSTGSSSIRKGTRALFFTAIKDHYEIDKVAERYANKQNNYPETFSRNPYGKVHKMDDAKGLDRHERTQSLRREAARKPVTNFISGSGLDNFDF